VSPFTNRLKNAERVGTDAKINAQLRKLFTPFHAALEKIAKRQAQSDHELKATMGRCEEWLETGHTLLSANFSH
jgi:hypothetical protein